MSSEVGFKRTNTRSTAKDEGERNECNDRSRKMIVSPTPLYLSLIYVACVTPSVRHRHSPSRMLFGQLVHRRGLHPCATRVTAQLPTLQTVAIPPNLHSPLATQAGRKTGHKLTTSEASICSTSAVPSFLVKADSGSDSDSCGTAAPWRPWPRGSALPPCRRFQSNKTARREAWPARSSP